MRNATETLVGKYTVTSENSGWKITFDPKDLSTVAGEKIYISFKMTLKEGAIVGSTGNTNEINLDYSNKILPEWILILTILKQMKSKMKPLFTRLESL